VQSDDWALEALLTAAFDNEDTLTHDEIQHRFKKIMGREMTPEEKHSFFLPPEIPADPNPEDA
jgi:hypothetical protein